MHDDEPDNETIKRAPRGQSKPRPGGSAFDSSARKGNVGASLKRASYFMVCALLPSPRHASQFQPKRPPKKSGDGASADAPPADAPLGDAPPPEGSAAEAGASASSHGGRGGGRSPYEAAEAVAAAAAPRAAADRQGLLHGR